MFKNFQFSQPRTKAFSLKGGLNSEISNMERKPGEMSTCINYMEASGEYSGYQSMKGYERFDGQTAPSDTDLETYDDWADATGYVLNDRVLYDGYVFYCQSAHTSDDGVNNPDSTTPGDNTWWVYEGAEDDVDEYTDRKREAVRDAIAAVPGSGSILGLQTYGNLVYAWRNNAGGTAIALYKSSSSGWTVVSGTNMTTPSGTVKAVHGRFADYNALADTMFWVDAVTAGVHVYDGSSYSQITTGLPGSSYATNLGIWENRLFVVYPDGHILFSVVGDPTDFSTSGYAGEINIGEEITNIIAVAGVLLIFGTRRIKILHYGSTADEFIFKLDDFSDKMGAISDTVQNLFESVFFCDDRGPTRMLPSAETGGFATENIGTKIQDLYLAVKDSITASTLDIENRRYYVFYTVGSVSNGFGFTIHKNRMKGIGRFELLHKAVVATHGVLDNGTTMALFGDNSGFVYQMEKGTSFDGSNIETRLATSFYNYGSPRNWKLFNRIQFEMSGDDTTEFTVGAKFEYSDVALQKLPTQDFTVTGGSAKWGSATWGSFKWGSGILGRIVAYVYGRGTNMAVTVETDSKYKTQHTLHNLAADYVIEGLKI